MPVFADPPYFSPAGAHLTPDRFTFEEKWTRRPKLNASADLNASFSNTEAEALAFANKDWELSGTNAADSLATFSTIGGVTLTTATAASDQVIVGGHTDSGVAPLANIDWSTAHGVSFYQKVYTGASVANTTIWAGMKLTSTPVVATDDDQAYFRIVNGAVSCIASNGGTDETLTTGVTLTASTAYELAVVIGPNDRKATFFINQDDGGWEELAQSAALAADVDLLPFVGIQTDAAAAKALTLLHTALGKKLVA